MKNKMIELTLHTAKWDEAPNPAFNEYIAPNFFSYIYYEINKTVTVRLDKGRNEQTAKLYYL
jgi:hypothetical protein